MPYHSNGMFLIKQRATNSQAAGKSAELAVHSAPRRMSSALLFRIMPVAFAGLCLFAVHARARPQLQDNEDHKLPNGKSQKDAIAKANHNQAVKEAKDLLALAQQLKDELENSGDHVLPASSVKKTEEIEKIARRIRSHLTE